MPINLRRVGEIADNSVTAAKLVDGAVTTNKLANLAVTAAKASGNLKSGFIVADDTTVSYTGTAYSNQKEMRFIKKVSDLPSGEILVKAEAMASVGTSNIGIFFNAETTPRIELISVGTGFTLLEGTAYIGDLSDGVHSVTMSLRNLDAGIAYNKLVEIHGRA